MTVEELMQNEEFLAKFAETEDMEAAAKLIKEYGADVTVDDIREAMNTVKSDELSEENLEDVAGGLSVGMIVGGVRVTIAILRWLLSHPGNLTIPRWLR